MRMIAGKTVQIVSISWASIVLVWVSFVVSIIVIRYKTSVLIRKTIISVWSWKCSNSSMIGEEASWKPNS